VKPIFKTGPLVEAMKNCAAKIIINQGGTSSGKTYSTLQLLFLKAIEEPDSIITVVGQDLPNLKVGAIRDSQTIVSSSSILSRFIEAYNKSDHFYKFNNGSVIEFKSYKDAQDAKSGKRKYLFVNEANGIPYDIYEQLSLRTSGQEFIDYNPTATFWVHEKLIGLDGVQLFITDHRHNPFVAQAIRDKIEALKWKDEELWKVYARGMTGKIEGLVFRNWKLCEEIPEGAKFIGSGLDFGFTNDPTVNIEVFMQNGELWINERLHSTGLTNQDISKELESLGIPKRRGIIADSAEPKSIEELKRLGWDVEAALKGPDSINISIGMLKNYVLNITKNSINLRKELMNYKWRIDKATGNPLNEPVDCFNHCIDALRYVALNRLVIKPGKIRSAPV